jgi:hypothetical protein
MAYEQGHQISDEELAQLQKASEGYEPPVTVRAPPEVVSFASFRVAARVDSFDVSHDLKMKAKNTLRMDQ